MMINSLVIAAALYIIVLSVAIFTTDIDGMIWMYRDLARLGQFPVSVYLELMRFALFFLVPIGMMITVPAELLINVGLSYSVLVAVAVGVTFFGFSLWLWHTALRSYTSASS
jgi:ABC-2 type transport system permease protein